MTDTNQTLAEAVSRLKQMAGPHSSRTWDLSPNDIDAIRQVLEDRDRYLHCLREIVATGPMSEPAIPRVLSASGAFQVGQNVKHWQLAKLAGAALNPEETP